MSHKVYILFMVLFLTTASFGKSLDFCNEQLEYLTAKEKLYIFTVGSFRQLGQEFGEKFLEISHDLLKDVSLLASDKAAVIEFKQNLNKYVHTYEANNKTVQVWEILQMYSTITDHYLQLPEGEVKPESKFIEQLLSQYQAKEFAKEFVSAFEYFLVNFKDMFERARASYEKPILDWYANFATINDFGEKLYAIAEFMELGEVCKIR